MWFFAAKFHKLGDKMRLFHLPQFSLQILICWNKLDHSDLELLLLCIGSGLTNRRQWIQTENKVRHWLIEDISWLVIDPLIFCHKILHKMLLSMVSFLGNVICANE